MTMTRAEWGAVFPAPAKLNLFLHVTGRRADGYHLIQSVFRLIDWADGLRFTPRSDNHCRLATPVAGLPPDDDLCVRAAKALQARGGVSRGVDIHLEKHLPLGGGLGGGSSDAATTLLALNRLWSVGLTGPELAEVALGLGADVPFFLSGENAFVEGIGERLTRIDLPSAWYLVLIPPVSVPTARVFAAPTLTRNTKIVKISSFSDAFHISLRPGSGDLAGNVSRSEIAATGAAGGQGSRSLFGRNDLEPVVRGLYPEVARHLDWLTAHAGESVPTVRMSGSGACVFAEFGAEAEAKTVAARLPPDMRGKVVRGLDRHPVFAMQEF